MYGIVLDVGRKCDLLAEDSVEKEAMQACDDFIAYDLEARTLSCLAAKASFIERGSCSAMMDDVLENCMKDEGQHSQ